MFRTKSIRISFLLFTILALALLPTLASATPMAPTVTLTPIGNPTWAPVDFHLFSAPIGTADSGYAEFFETMQALLPPPNHMPHPSLGIGPGAPHSPPYDAEMAAGVANNGYHEGVSFYPREFSNGMGVWLTWTNVPNPGTTGSSPDFDSGAIIPNSLFPIHVEGATLFRRTVFDPWQTFNPWLAYFDVPALDASLDPPFDVDGHSHFPVFIAENSDFGPPAPKPNGRYAFQITMIDASGNGWAVNAYFAVAPIRVGQPDALTQAYLPLIRSVSR